MKRRFSRKETLPLTPSLILIPLYQNFFHFLDLIEKGEDAWPLYWRYYYFPYRKFFDAYFALFPLLDRQALKIRVGAIKPNHYSRLRSLLKNRQAEKIIGKIHQHCLKIAPPEKNRPIKVYLMIGFFSPEAFLLSLGQEKVIVFGLERFRDLAFLDLLYAHEYAHYLLQEKSFEIADERKASWYLLSEGLACWFSSLVLPGRPLTDYLFLRRDRFNWCLENEALLKKIFKLFKQDLEKIMRLQQQGDQSLGLPPRTLHFLAYRAIEKYQKQEKDLTFRKLIQQPEKLLSLNLAD
ncbi:MAG: hypothetical protein N3B16_12240 [Candidatus Aminicenantes bacterium]|nr:hypothetical protein [Candidatus Aminicenantes bacterium]